MRGDLTDATLRSSRLSSRAPPKSRCRRRASPPAPSDVAKLAVSAAVCRPNCLRVITIDAPSVRCAASLLLAHSALPLRANRSCAEAGAKRAACQSHRRTISVRLPVHVLFNRCRELPILLVHRSYLLDMSLEPLGDHLLDKTELSVNIRQVPLCCQHRGCLSAWLTGTQAVLAHRSTALLVSPHLCLVRQDKRRHTTVDRGQHRRRPRSRRTRITTRAIISQESMVVHVTHVPSGWVGHLHTLRASATGCCGTTGALDDNKAEPRATPTSLRLRTQSPIELHA